MESVWVYQGDFFSSALPEGAGAGNFGKFLSIVATVAWHCTVLHCTTLYSASLHTVEVQPGDNVLHYRQRRGEGEGTNITLLGRGGDVGAKEGCTLQTLNILQTLQTVHLTLYTAHCNVHCTVHRQYF